MSYDARIKNLQKDIVLLQHYISSRGDVGFHDMKRYIESISITVFRVTHGLSLVNKNQIRVNFPAIDIADDKQRVAIQVTTNASSAKVKKTIETFERHGLKAAYDSLIIFGFCKTAKTNPSTSYCTVLGIPQIIDTIVDHVNDDGLQEICDAIQRHQDYARLHPWEDKECLEIVLNYVDRDAVKHRMSCEGSVADMLSGLKEISELIGKGTVERRVKSKPIDDFNDAETISFLRFVKDCVTQITSIVNASRVSGDMACISYPDMETIDRIKRSLIERSNDIARQKGIAISILV